MNNTRLSFHRNHLPLYACRPVRGLMLRDYAKRLLTGSAAAAAGWGRSSSLFLFFTRFLFSAQPLRPALMIAFVRFGLTGFLFALFVACGGGGGGGGGGGSSPNGPPFSLTAVSVNGMNVTEENPIYLDRGTPAIFSANILCANLCGEVRLGYFRSDDIIFSQDEDEEINSITITLNAAGSGQQIDFNFTGEEAAGRHHYGVCIDNACVPAVEITVAGLEITDLSARPVLMQNEETLNITTEVFCHGQLPCAGALDFYLSSDEDVSNEDRELATLTVDVENGTMSSHSSPVNLRVPRIGPVPGIGPGNYHIGACADGGCTPGQILVVAGVNFVDFVVSLPLVKPEDSLNLTSLPLVRPEDSLNLTVQVRCYGEAACNSTTVYSFRMLGAVSEQLETEGNVVLAGETTRDFVFTGETVNYIEDLASYDVCTDLARTVCTDQMNVFLDSDGNGTANRFDDDDDNDTLLDTADTGENSTSMIPCRLLTDCDGDGLDDIADTGENSANVPCRVLTDCDGDGIDDIADTGENSANVPCRVLTDCDGDGLNDNEDRGENSDGILCRVLTDCDGDGLNDNEDTGENSATMISCRLLTDCDDDGLNDNEDTGVNSVSLISCRVLTDCDDDGLNDNEETGENSANIPCRVLADCDDDGIDDIADIGVNNVTMPCHLLPDCDSDGLLDIADTGENSTSLVLCRVLADCDSDGLLDIADTGENNATMIPCRVLSDCDDDGLLDIADTGENNASLIPCRVLSDCDGDGLDDIEDTGENSESMIPCRVLTDCDDDGLLDNADTGENSASLIPCRVLTDCDDDGLGDIADTGENNVSLISCRLLPDCDNDGLLDNEDTGENNESMIPCRLLPNCDFDEVNDNEDRGVNSAGTSCHLLPDCDSDGFNDMEDVDADGDGLIELQTAEELHNIRFVLDGNGYKFNSTATKDTTGCPDTVNCSGYELVAAVDLSSSGNWEPIGSSSDRFTAIFDGNGFPIRNLFINRRSLVGVGFFGAISGSALIRSVVLARVRVTGRTDVGGLVGNSAASGKITDSAVSGEVRSFHILDEINVGGLVGHGQGVIINTSSFRGNVLAVRDFLFRQGDAVGGLAGNGRNAMIISSYYVGGRVHADSFGGGLIGDGRNARITTSYARGLVNGDDSLGGLVGRGNGATITASYSSGMVDSDDEHAGGLIGTTDSSQGSTIVASYARVTMQAQRLGYGGLVGRRLGVDDPNQRITNSYWDSTLNFRGDGAGEAKTQAELRSPTDATGIYAGWMQTCPNDATVFAWDFGDGTQYPVLNCPPGGALSQSR